MNTPQTVLLPGLQAVTDRLAEALVQAPPIAAYRHAKACFDADPQAYALLERFSAARSELRAREASNTLTQADIDQARALEQQVRSNPTLMDYFVAQQMAIAYLKEVNQEISQWLGMNFGAMAASKRC